MLKEKVEVEVEEGDVIYLVNKLNNNFNNNIIKINGSIT